jgi:2-pyrone-4,6-dicarboxylate lactonase
VRFNYMKHLGGGPQIADVMKLSNKLVGLGWHLQIHLEPSLILQMMPELKFSPVPVVIDHMGRIDASRGLDQPGFTHLLKMLEDKRFWVKVSGLSAPRASARRTTTRCRSRASWSPSSAIAASGAATGRIRT